MNNSFPPRDPPQNHVFGVISARISHFAPECSLPPAMLALWVDVPVRGTATSPAQPLPASRAGKSTTVLALWVANGGKSSGGRGVFCESKKV